MATELKNRHKRFPFLVIAPLRACYLVWPAECKKWEEFNHFKVSILHGSKKEQALREKSDLYVVNPEGLQWLFDTIDELGIWPFEGIIVDESTKFKNGQNIRSKLLRYYLPRFRRRHILTGSPSPNGLEDLFGQIYILDQGGALGKYITKYRLEYFYPTGYGGYTWKPQKGAEERIYAKIAPLVLRMSEKDFLKLPKLHGVGDAEKGIEPNLVEVDLPKAARAAYDEMEDELFLLMKEGKITAANGAVAQMKCAQIANGGLYLDSPKNTRWKLMHEAKTDAVLELVESMQGRPALIAVDFRHDEERLLKALPKGTPCLTGIKNMNELKRIERAWNVGDLPVMLGNPQSMAHALNLQGGQAVIWHSLTYSYELYDQFIRRLWRSGQKRPVFVYHIYARNTVDAAKMAAIKLKGKVQGALLAALREYSLARSPALRRALAAAKKA